MSLKWIAYLLLTSYTDRNDNSITHRPAVYCDYILFCSLAVLDQRVGHTKDVLSPLIHLLPLLILNEYAARHAVTRHYLGLVNVDE